MCVQGVRYQLTVTISPILPGHKLFKKGHMFGRLDLPVFEGKVQERSKLNHRPFSNVYGMSDRFDRYLRIIPQVRKPCLPYITIRYHSRIPECALSRVAVLGAGIDKATAALEDTFYFAPS
jgi:hypothetical protein